MFSGNHFAVIALVASFAGVVGLLSFSLLAQPMRAKIGEIGAESIGLKVEAEGAVKSSFIAKNTLFFTLGSLTDMNSIRVVAFRPSEEKREIARKGSVVRVIGKVAEYEGKLEIIAEKISRAGSGME